jgi:hypothetical protein
MLVRVVIEPGKKKKRCLKKEIKCLEGERIHLRFCENALNLLVGFLSFSFHITFSHVSVFVLAGQSALSIAALLSIGAMM